MINTTSGFTLIELLVTLTIAGLLVSFVGPTTLQQFEASKAKAEHQQLISVIRTVSNQSFSSNEVNELELIDNQLKSTVHLSTKALTYNFISFPQQKIVFNANGFTQTEFIEYLYNNEKRTVSIFDALGMQEGKVVVLPN
ncbi:MAG: hypothetical protein CMK65_00865 [Pseudoalteromonas sp.]|uniref:type II secretion system protein n=1 Tax=Pseudoalteromonas sp. TaxID=53249 RepID=UPI000C96F5D3|nr:type II secretion system protein [Pseudoalteromonas sp.]MAD02164.1 hypothetical protein [Pseudoalteromonas sp.]